MATQIIPSITGMHPMSIPVWWEWDAIASPRIRNKTPMVNKIIGTAISGKTSFVRDQYGNTK